MKHLQGKKIRITLIENTQFTGVVTGATDEIVKILIDKDPDEIVILAKNILFYQVLGEGTSGGVSGLQVYACKNLNINCKGKLKISLNKSLTIQDMQCQVCKRNTVLGTGFKCDFGTLGEMQVLPSKVQRVLFDGLIKDNNKGNKKNG